MGHARAFTPIAYVFKPYGNAAAASAAQPWFTGSVTLDQPPPIGGDAQVTWAFSTRLDVHRQADQAGVVMARTTRTKGGTAYFKVEGDEELLTKFRKLGFKTSDLGGVFHQIAAEVTADAKTLAPHLTGRLAGDVRPSSAKTRASIVVGRASVPYAGPQNYGWAARNIAPHLFMNRAADSKANTSADRIAKEIKRQIRSAGLG